MLMRVRPLLFLALLLAALSASGGLLDWDPGAKVAGESTQGVAQFSGPA
jgi:hypothetical protein